MVFAHVFNVYCDIIIPTKYGNVRGKETEYGFAFLGIPYAAPPIGNARFVSITSTAPTNKAKHIRCAHAQFNSVIRLKKSLFGTFGRQILASERYPIDN